MYHVEWGVGGCSVLKFVKNNQTNNHSVSMTAIHTLLLWYNVRKKKLAKQTETSLSKP